MYQNAGEKGLRHADPDDPPRRRANKIKGHGTWANDRIPIGGVAGRQSGGYRLEVLHRADKRTLQAMIERHTRPGSTVDTDEWHGYNDIAASGRRHRTVVHQPGRREWARDDDGDGVREVHNNTMEGGWTTVRNVLRPFRGVSKWFLSGYAAIAELTLNIHEFTPALLRIMLIPCTCFPT